MEKTNEEYRKLLKLISYIVEPTFENHQQYAVITNSELPADILENFMKAVDILNAKYIQNGAYYIEVVRELPEKFIHVQDNLYLIPFEYGISAEQGKIQVMNLWLYHKCVGDLMNETPKFDMELIDIYENGDGLFFANILMPEVYKD